LGIREDYS